MSDPDHGPRESDVEPIQFGEWLEMTAESHGSSTEEVLEQLISSYWTINEMTEMIQQPEGTPREPDEAAMDHPVSGRMVPPSRSEFEDFASEVEAHMESFEDRLASFESEGGQENEEIVERFEKRLDTEFDTLRRILERLITMANENGEEIDELYERVARDIGGFLDEQSRLDDLRRQAMELGITNAECDNCGRSVDLTLLPSPSCTTCGRTFTKLEPGKKILGLRVGANSLKTEVGSSSRQRVAMERGGDDRQRSHRDNEGSTDHRIRGFNWQEKRGQ